MRYELTFWSKPHAAHTYKATSLHPTAAMAWVRYQHLVASEETVEIRDANGRQLTWQALKVLAHRVTH